MTETPPATESRVKKTLLNARVNLIFYFLTLALSFFSRKIFLDTLGADFVGLTGTLQNLLGFLNLAELGIGSAIGYVLYKPIFDKDHQKINEIISVMGYLYRWIGGVILATGIILALCLPLIFPHTAFDLSLIYFAYFSFLASSLIGYFINYRQNLLGADQRNYVVTAYYQSMTIGKTILQMALAYYTRNYYLWVIVELTFGIVYSFVLNWKIDQTYPWLRAEIKLGKALFQKYLEVMKYTKKLFIHQINSFAQFQTTPFLVYTFVSLEVVAFYGNYTLIVDKLTQLMNTVLGSAAAGVGNLIAEGNKNKIEGVFWELTGIRFWIAGIIVFSLYVLMDDFISFWIGNTYILPKVILVLLLLKIYLQIIVGCLGQFLYGFGLFNDVWSSFLQTALFLAFAIIGGYLYGLQGILFASIISLFVVCGLWKPYYLYSKGLKTSIWNYWLKWLQYNLLTIISFGISWGIVYNFKSLTYHHSCLKFILYAFCVVSTNVIVSFIIYYLFCSSFRTILFRLKK